MDATQLTSLFHSAHLISVPAGKKYEKPLHQHAQTAEILMILEGTGQITVNKKIYPVHEGSIVLYNSGDWHAEKTFPRLPFKALVLCCSGGLQPGLPLGQIRPSTLAPVQKLAEFPKLALLLDELIKENSSMHPNRQTTVHHLQTVFLEVLSRSLCTEVCKAAPDQLQHVRLAQHFIEETCSQELTLERISVEVGLSKYYIARLFKEAMGISPMQYAIQCRLRLAEQLLLGSDDPVGDIALKTGYKSEPHFQQAFKKSFGMAPGAYRKKAVIQHSI